jgi:hypothetical protein
MHAELDAIKELIGTAKISSEAKRTALWCLGQWPTLHQRLSETYDSRFREEILRLEQAVLKPFGKKPDSVAQAIREQLIALHTRLGFEGNTRGAA